MAEDGHAIGVNLPAHLLPTATEGVVLRQVPARLGVDHAIENGKILLKVTILVVIHTLELWVPLVHLCEHVTLDEHEAGGTVQNLREPIHNLSILILEIHHEGCRDPSKVPTRPTTLEVLIDTVPHHTLLGITGHRNLVVRLDETDNGFWIEMNVGINEQKVRSLWALLVEPSDGQVTGTVHKGLVLRRIKHHLYTVCCTRALETKHGLGIGLETNATITWCTYEKGNLSAHSELNITIP